MKYAVVLCSVCAVLSACSDDPYRPDSLDADATRLYSRSDLDRRKEFEEAVVGHELRGDGVEVTVAPDGALIGTHLGKPFLGSWEYRRGQFCVSMTTDNPRRAPDRRCFRAAINGREVILHPIIED